jgi:hypothetical protein
MTLLHSFAHSASALKELRKLIPNFQKKIDEAEPGDAQQFYITVSLGIYGYCLVSSNLLQLQDSTKNACSDDVSKLMSLPCYQSSAMAVVSTILLRECFFALFDTTGMMKSESFFRYY